jgi:hypothetical protein
LAQNATRERADLHVRIARAKKQQGKPREAVANFEKALALLSHQAEPEAHAAVLEDLIRLNLAENDFRALASTEDRLLAMTQAPELRFSMLLTSAARWKAASGDPARILQTLERACELRPDDLGVLEQLRDAYDAAGATQNAFAARRRIADCTHEPRARAERYFELAQMCFAEPGREDLGLELADRALASDPTMLDPLTVVARVLAERQEWSELARAYRRMLGRVERIPKGPVRTEVTWELCVRLGLVFRDHLEDEALSLDAFEDAVAEKPRDLRARLIVIELARKLGHPSRAVGHLIAAAELDAHRAQTFHDLFEVAQKTRLADQAYHAAAVTTFLGDADARERFVFEENRAEALPKFAAALDAEAWEYLADGHRDVHAEAVLAAVARAAIEARLEKMDQEGRLPSLDPALAVDVESSTVGVVRSFVWASHYLGLKLPAIHLSEDPDLKIAALPAQEPTVVLGQKVLGGLTLTELAFVAGRHLAYHVDRHRVLLFYASLEELSECWVAAVQIVRRQDAEGAEAGASPNGQVSDATSPSELEQRISRHLTDDERAALSQAVHAFLKQERPVHLHDWVAAVERSATRAGYLLADDLRTAAAILAEDEVGVLSADAKTDDLLAFSVSEELFLLRQGMGVAVQP